MENRVGNLSHIKETFIDSLFAGYKEIITLALSSGILRTLLNKRS